MTTHMRAHIEKVRLRVRRGNLRRAKKELDGRAFQSRSSGGAMGHGPHGVKTGGEQVQGRSVLYCSETGDSGGQSVSRITENGGVRRGVSEVCSLVPLRFARLIDLAAALSTAGSLQEPSRRNILGINH